MEENVHFIVLSDSRNDFNLMIEAYIGDWCLADFRKVNGQWLFTFFTPPNAHTYEIAGTTFFAIAQRFEQFMKEENLETEEEDAQEKR